MFAILLLTAAQVASTALPPTAFEPLAKLVGHCWRAVIGKDTTDRHCFEAIYGGTHIKDAHVVSAGGRAVYSGETIYSAEGSAITFVYVNSLGGVGRGTATQATDGLAFRLTMRATPASKSEESRTSWHFTKGGFDVVSGSETRSFNRDD